VLSNLIVNASEALGKTGNRLLIHVYDSPDWKDAGRKGVRIVVADNGCGIPREVRQKVFEPFFKEYSGERSDCPPVRVLGVACSLTLRAL
jgi:signal transduction histidine kinase